MYKSSSLVPMKQYPYIIARISASSLKLWNPLHKHTTTSVYINIKFGAAMISYKVKVTAKKLKENVPTFSLFGNVLAKCTASITDHLLPPLTQEV